MNKLPMTAAGYSVLESELKRRIQLDRPRLIERLQQAIADDSNLTENPEYQAVKSEVIRGRGVHMAKGVQTTRSHKTTCLRCGSDHNNHKSLGACDFVVGTTRQPSH